MTTLSPLAAAPPLVQVYNLPPIPLDSELQQCLNMWINEGMKVEDLLRVAFQYSSDFSMGLPLDPILQRKIPLWENFPTDPVAQCRIFSLANQLVGYLVRYYATWLNHYRLHFDRNVSVRLVAARRHGDVTIVVANPYLPLDAVIANAQMLGVNLVSDYSVALPQPPFEMAAGGFGSTGVLA